MMQDARTHPMRRALWWPRLDEAIGWIGATMAAQVSDGSRVLAAELRGAIDLAGVTLTATAARIDRLGTGGSGIVVYKSGQPHSSAAGLPDQGVGGLRSMRVRGFDTGWSEEP